MKKSKLLMVLTCFLSISSAPFISNSLAAPIIIDHTALDHFSALSDSTIDAVQANIRLHYAHTSHGGQLTTGLQRLENTDSKYDIAIQYSSLPSVAGALNIFDGQEGDTYITPDEYWESPAGVGLTNAVLNNNPTINVSMWSWCTQANTYSQAQIQQYLDQMALFEALHPDVTFVYMTGNAQTGPGNHYNQSLSQGYNRYLRNEQIRAWVKAGANRVLFDFADIDSWWKDPQNGWQQATFSYNGIDVPYEHPHYNLNQAAHTSYENCDNKGMAMWVLMSEIYAAANPVPIPGAVLLLGPGLLFILGVRKIRR